MEQKKKSNLQTIYVYKEDICKGSYLTSFFLNLMTERERRLFNEETQSLIRKLLMIVIIILIKNS